MSEKKKPQAERAKALEALIERRVQDAEGETRFPTLFDLMRPREQDGIPTRQAGRLAVKIEGVQYRWTLDCPTEGLMTIIYLDSLLDAFELLERALAAGKCIWLPNYESQKKGRPVIDKLL